MAHRTTKLSENEIYILKFLNVKEIMKKIMKITLTFRFLEIGVVMFTDFLHKRNHISQGYQHKMAEGGENSKFPFKTLTNL